MVDLELQGSKMFPGRIAFPVAFQGVLPTLHHPRTPIEGQLRGFPIGIHIAFQVIGVPSGLLVVEYIEDGLLLLLVCLWVTEYGNQKQQKGNHFFHGLVVYFVFPAALCILSTSILVRASILCHLWPSMASAAIRDLSLSATVAAISVR